MTLRPYRPADCAQILAIYGPIIAHSSATFEVEVPSLNDFSERLARIAADRVRIGVGEAVPADGVLLDAAAAVDESLLTGESTPVPKAPGDALYAGSTNREAVAWLRVERTGADTRLSQLARTVEHAQSERPRLARWAGYRVWRDPLVLGATAVGLAGAEERLLTGA